MKNSGVYGRWKMPMHAVVWLCTMLLLLVYTYEEIPVWTYSIFILITILFFVGSDRLSFFYYILLTVGTVFVFVILSFRDSWTPMEQAMAIGLHFVLLIHLFALYSISKYIYQFRAENRMLSRRIADLEEYISEGDVLTTREFNKQAAIILSTMERRKETGFFMKVDLSNLPKRVRRTALVKVGSILNMTVRRHYDIVGKYDEHAIVVLIQNTDQNGLAVVQKRMDENLQSELEAAAIEKMQWTVKEVEGQKGLDGGAVIL